MTVLRLAATVRRDAFVLDVDLAASAGEVVGVTGDIGSGKSTILALAAGSLRAEDGLVAYGDVLWDQPATSTFVADRPVSAMAQAYLGDLPEDLTGTDVVVANIERFASGFRADDRSSVEYARSVLAGLGVQDHVVDRLPWTFSGAEAQRVALARAIAPHPPVLLLDEPFGALDKRTGQTVRDWLADWLKDFAGIALVASTRVDHLEVFANRVITLD